MPATLSARRDAHIRASRAPARALTDSDRLAVQFAALWAGGHDTNAIARSTGCAESLVANTLAAMRERRKGRR